ncbi:MAG: hypothetical protein JWO20_2116 [Candidatus Angelobacter sp.]|nr:hypothetical protein [Candidatus Angelobacter sp.]
MQVIGKQLFVRYHRGMRIWKNLILVVCLSIALSRVMAEAQKQKESDSAPQSYSASILKWREERQSKLRADDGWLTVAGLFWLKEGENTFGSEKSNDIELPKSAPPKAGSFLLKQGKVILRLNPGIQMALNGKPAQETELHPDSDKLQSGSLTIFVINRGDKVGIRLKDKNSAARKDFKGLSYYPIDPKLRVIADFIPYDPPKKIAIPTVLGTKVEEPSPGRAEFAIAGKKFSLEPVEEDADTLFFIFKDPTAGPETYGAGRFLYTPKPRDGKVILDFNKAENPPCAFTPYATCPLPPPQNRLDAPIRAGEKKYGNH